MSDSAMTLFLCGDVMTGRGIDQILPHPSDPVLYESYLSSSIDYVELAEASSGRLPRPAPFDYPWGDLLPVIHTADRRIVNLETAITSFDTAWPKGINYRMSPLNIPCLSAANIDCCVLANNHVIDWGYDGLGETLAVLHHAGIATAGAGNDRAESDAPALLEIPDKGRVVVLAFAHASSGVPPGWAARAKWPGITILRDLSTQCADSVIARVQAVKRPADVVVISIHWGGNWGFRVPTEQTTFAHALIDSGYVDVIHGHSSHHVKAIEVYRGKLVLYGCGDLLNDYEGITGYEQFRNDLSFAYLPRIDPASGRLESLELIPTRIHQFRVSRAHGADSTWLSETVNREGRRFGTRVESEQDGLVLRWRE